MTGTPLPADRRPEFADHQAEVARELRAESVARPPRNPWRIALLVGWATLFLLALVCTAVANVKSSPSLYWGTAISAGTLRELGRELFVYGCAVLALHVAVLAVLWKPPTVVAETPAPTEADPTD